MSETDPSAITDADVRDAAEYMSGYERLRAIETAARAAVVAHRFGSVREQRDAMDALEGLLKPAKFDASLTVTL